MNENLRDAAFRAGVWSLIEAKAKEQKDAAKAELRSLEPGDAVSGKWHGQPVAKATMTKGRTKLVVTDEQKFLDWVQEYAPTEIVRSVNPAYMKAIEARAKNLGAPVNLDGELYPGLDLQEGDPYVSIRKADGAEAVIAELFRTGAVGLDGIAHAALPPVVDAAHLDSLPSNRWTEDQEAGAIG